MDSLTRPHGVLPSLKPDSVDWIPGAPPGKSLTGMQFQYEAPMRHRPEMQKMDSLTRPHGVLPSLKPDSVDWIPGAPPGKSLTGMQFQYEAPMRHRPEAFAADSAIRGIPSPRRRPVNL